MEQIRLLQFLQIAVNGLVVNAAVLGFEIVGDGLGGKRPAHVVEDVLHDALQLVDLPHLVALDDVRKNRGIVDVAHDGIDLVGGKCL